MSRTEEIKEYAEYIIKCAEASVAPYTLLKKCGNHASKIIELLESKPEPTEFTRRIIEQKDVWQELPNDSVTLWVAKRLHEACDEIDRLSAELKAKDELIEEWRTFGCPNCRRNADL
jgi:hypothetical protein